MQALSSDDMPVIDGLELTPGVGPSVGAATESVKDALQNVVALPQGNKASCRKLLAHKVCCVTWQVVTIQTYMSHDCQEKLPLRDQGTSTTQRPKVPMMGCSTI